MSLVAYFLQEMPVLQVSAQSKHSAMPDRDIVMSHETW